MKRVINSLKVQVSACERHIENNIRSIKNNQEAIEELTQLNEDYRKTIDECNTAIGILEKV